MGDHVNGDRYIAKYIEKLKGTLCTHIVYDVGVSGILPFSLPPACFQLPSKTRIMGVVMIEVRIWIWTIAIIGWISLVVALLLI